MAEVVAVEAQGVGLSYGERTALAEVGFAVEVGEIFGFLGPNGGGKTSLFRVLATLRSPDAGSVRIFGLDVVTAAGRVRRRLGVVFQAPSVDEQLTVMENLVHQGHLYGLRGVELRQRAMALLEEFGLAQRRGDRLSTLSGGLRRRIEIAKALLHRPPLLLLDEPSSGLDPGARRDLWRLLEKLRGSQQVTVLLTTHFMEEGDRCDRLALLDRGRIVAAGSPAELKQEIGGDVVTVSGQAPGALAKELRDRFELEAVVYGDTVRFEHPRGHQLAGDLLQRLPGRMQALTISKPTLEDVFLRRTGRGLWEDER